MVRGGPAPGFTVSAPDVTVTQGTTGTVPVTVTLSACFSGVPQYSAASVGGIPMGLPGGTPVAVNGAGSAVAGFSFFAPMSMVPGTYAGTATVTIGLISHAAAFSVKVVPNSTPYYTFTPFNSAPLVPGGSVTRYFVVQKQNGYNGVPVFSVNPAFLPAGISVVFSDGGKATYGTATATISAANAVVPNNGFSIPVDSSDGALSVSFPVGVQIVAAPLGVTYSVAYSNISPATKRATAAVLTPRLTGGTPPFTVTGTGLGAQSGTTFTTNGSADAVGTLTVTDASGTVVTVAATIPAAPVVPDAILASMAMERILAFESQAAQLVARGKDDSALRAAFLAAAKISAMDYAGLRNMAVSYKSSQSGAVQAAQTALGAVLRAGAVPGMASPTVAQARALQTLQTDYNQGVGLAAALGPAFSGLAGAAAMVSTVIGPGGGGGNGPILHVPANCPPDWTQCPQLVSDSEVSVDPVSGWVSGSAWSYLVFNGSLTSYAKLQAKVDAGLDGPGGHLDGNSAEDDNGGTARVALGAQATADGLYTVSGFGTGMAEDAALNFYHFDGNATFRNSDKWKAPACSGPVVTAITVDGAGTNAFVAGASGTAVVSGTCLAGVTGVSLSGALQGQQGQRLALTLGPVGFDQVSLAYRVDAGATASSGSVLLSAGSGTVSIPAMVVPSLPYISAITPSPWQAGTSTAFAISGAGFGLSPTVTITSDQLGGLAATYCTVLYPCSDGLIQGTVDLPVETIPDSASVSITFGGFQNGFASAQEPIGRYAIAPVNITPTPPPNLTMTSNGQPLPPNTCAVVSAEPSMPSLGFRLIPSTSTKLFGRVAWTLAIQYVRSDGTQDQRTFVSTLPVDASTAWQPTFDSDFRGGNAVLTWTYQVLPKSTASFCIVGINPAPAAVKAYVAVASQHWALPKLIAQESSWQQFTSSGLPNTDGGSAPGFGLMQLTNPKPEASQIWHWRQNVDVGLQVFAQKMASGLAYWQRLVATYNGSGALLPIDQTESGCTFSYSPSAGQHPFSDAVGLKRYNGASNGDYINWTATTGWQYSNSASNGHNYVAAVCSHADTFLGN